MQIVTKTACSNSHFFAQEQHEFVRHTLKLIIRVSNLIPDFKSSKPDDRKDNNVNPKDYTSSKNFHISLNCLQHTKISLTYSLYNLISVSIFDKYRNS